MLDSDLADLYGVPTRVLNQAVKRSLRRFPPDFMFQLSPEEYIVLRSQIVTSKKRGGRRYLPYAFTEQGIAMLSSVLDSETAINVNIQILRVFTRIKKMALSNKDLMLKLEKLENKILHFDGKHKKLEGEIRRVFEALRILVVQRSEPRKKMGYKRKDEQ